MKKYIIYARENCNFCTKLQMFMKEKDLPFLYVVYHNLDSELKDVMEKYNWRTVPLVVERDSDVEKFIGGCDDTIELIKRRESE